MDQSPGAVLDRHREEVRRIVAAHGLSNPRVFGSVARGQDVAGSDIDLMVDAGPAATGFDLGGAYLELTGLLGVGVDLITARQVP